MDPKSIASASFAMPAKRKTVLRFYRMLQENRYAVLLLHLIYIIQYSGKVVKSKTEEEFRQKVRRCKGRKEGMRVEPSFVLLIVGRCLYAKGKHEFYAFEFRFF